MTIKLKILALALSLTAVATGSSAQTVLMSQSQLRQMALEHSEDLKIQNNKYEQSKLDKGIALAGYLPKFDATGIGAYIGPDIDMAGTDLVMRGMYLAGITLTQPIYTGGKIIAGNRMAKIGNEIAGEQLRMTRMDVIAEADNNYWSLIAVKEKVRMLESMKSLVDTLLMQTQVAVDAGMATDNDLLTIRSKSSEIDYQLQKARNGEELCVMSLCYVAGLDPETEIIPTDTVIQINLPQADGCSSELRPEINILKKQIELNKQQIKSTRADMLPMICLTAGYTYFGNIKMEGTTMLPDGTPFNYSQEMKEGIGVAMLAVQVPIFHWGENRKKVKKAKLDLMNSELSLQKNSNLINIEIRQAVQNLNDGYKMVAVANTAMKEADENLRVTRNRYASSMATVSEMLDAQAQWQQSYSNKIEAETQYKIYETAYLKATGRLE